MHDWSKPVLQSFVNGVSISTLILYCTASSTKAEETVNFYGGSGQEVSLNCKLEWI